MLQDYNMSHIKLQFLQKYHVLNTRRMSHAYSCCLSDLISLLRHREESTLSPSCGGFHIVFSQGIILLW